MASDAQKPLVALGPFRGIDTTTVPIRVEEGRARVAVGADPTRSPGAMTTAQGRVHLVDLTEGGTVITIVEFVVDATHRYLVCSSTTGNVAYDPDRNTQTSIFDTFTFQQAVAFDGVLFTSAGHQIQPVSGGFSESIWQHAPGDIGATTFTVAAISGPTFPAQAYSYAYTIITVYPNGAVEESAAVGADVASGSLTYPFTVTTNGSQIPEITDIVGVATDKWSGTQIDDALPWYMRIYRQSTGQPVWFLAASAYPPDYGTGASMHILINGSPFDDGFVDSFLTGNLQLQDGGQPPPTTSGSQAVIFSHKDRLWVFALVTDADTNAITQCQLWYSGFGLPWQFDDVNGVLLVGSEDLPVSAAYGGFGDVPVAAMSLSSVGVMWKANTIWILYGDDPTTFIVRKVADMGLIAARSVAECQGVVYGLYDEGFYSFDAATIPQYVGERMRGFLDTLTPAQKQSAVGWFAERSYWVSFPAVAQTYRYHLPSGEWVGPLPYATSSVFASAAQQMPTLTGVLLKNDFVAAVRPASATLDLWGAAETDLGASTVTATWVTAISDSGAPFAEKSYNLLGLNAPVQPGAIATVELLVDQGLSPAKVSGPFSIDLSKGTTAITTVGVAGEGGPMTGFLAQVIVTLTCPAATAPATIWAVAVYGDVQRNVVAVDNGAVTS